MQEQWNHISFIGTHLHNAYAMPKEGHCNLTVESSFFQI